MSKFLTVVSWSEVPHLDNAAKAGLLSSFLPHERDARTKGIPSIGAGAIYPVPEEDVACDPFEFPAWYRHFFAMDVGWNRTAALWGAYDPDTDVVYIYAEYYRGQAEPSVHAAAIRARGEWINGVIDPASRGRGQKDGEQLFSNYQELGLKITAANNRVTGPESGLLAVWQRLSTGRLKVFRTLQNFWLEYRIYRRSEKGAVVKDNDHLMDACRYGIVSGLEVATVRPFEDWKGRPGMPLLKSGKFTAEYAPMADAWNVVSQPARPNWTPGSSR